MKAAKEPHFAHLSLLGALAITIRLPTPDDACKT